MSPEAQTARLSQAAFDLRAHLERHGPQILTPDGFLWLCKVMGRQESALRSAIRELLSAGIAICHGRELYIPEVIVNPSEGTQP